MAFDTLKIIAHGITWYIPYIFRAGLQSIYTLYHFYTYRATDSPKHIVVIGGSFAGLQLVKRLTQTIPSGYKIIWIEKNSHLNYVFAFPRFSVVAGLEERAFIPYTALEAGAPKGCLRRTQGTVSWINREEQKIVIDSGEEIPFSYLAIATGSTQPLPVQVESTERTEACDELRAVQNHIKTSQKIAILGGGAVGVELASDVKDFYPDKEVTLVHSRDALLNRFGPRLQEYALRALRDELGVRVLLGERPVRPTAYGKGSLARYATLVFKDGKEEMFDLVVGFVPSLSPFSFHFSFFEGNV
jgi:NADH dehydrogenase FAD-containing subunit